MKRTDGGKEQKRRRYYDPLRDKGALDAERLKQAGVSVKLKKYEGMIHNFIRMGSLFEQADQALDLAPGELRQAFASISSGSSRK